MDLLERLWAFLGGFIYPPCQLANREEFTNTEAAETRPRSSKESYVSDMCNGKNLPACPSKVKTEVKASHLQDQPLSTERQIKKARQPHHSSK